MQWNVEAGGGFTDGIPWLPLHKDYYKINVESETADQHSVLNTYHKLIALRKSIPVLQQGDIEFTKTGRNGVLSYTRTLGTHQIHVVLNFSKYKRILHISNSYKILFSTHQKDTFDDENDILQPFEGVVIQLTIDN